MLICQQAEHVAKMRSYEVFTYVSKCVFKLKTFQKLYVMV